MKIRRFWLVAVLSVLFVSAPVHADEPYKVGEQMAEIVLDDQHGESRSIGGETRQVLFTRDMDAGDIVKAALATDGAKLLEQSGTVYLADISGMPGLVRRMFALPGLRKREYSMVLDIEGELTRRIPGEAGKATLISLDGGKITALATLGTSEEVTSALTAPAPS